MRCGPSPTEPYNHTDIIYMMFAQTLEDLDDANDVQMCNYFFGKQNVFENMIVSVFKLVFGTYFAKL